MSAAYVQSVVASNGNVKQLQSPSFTPTATNFIAVAFCYNNLAFVNQGVSTPNVFDTSNNNWGLIDYRFASSYNILLYGCYANASSPTQVTVQLGTGFFNTSMSLIAAEYSGLDKARFAGSAFTNILSGTSITVPTQNGVNIGDLILCAGFDNSHGTTWSFSADFTIREQHIFGNQSFMLADFVPGSGGSVGGETITLNLAANGGGAGVMVADIQNSSTVRMRDSQMAVEKLMRVVPRAVMSQYAVEKLVYPNPRLHLSQMAIEIVEPYVNPQQQFLQFLLV